MRKLTHAAAALIAFCGAQIVASPVCAFDACLGAKVTACLEAIRPHLNALEHRLARKDIDNYLAGDVTGARKSKSSFSVAYQSKFADPTDPPQLLTLDYSSSLRINMLEVTLRKGVAVAESEADYQATHMYETALFALGTRPNCPELATPHNFYLFFHTKVRPRLKESKQRRRKGEFTPAEEFTGETGWIGICGNSMNFILSSAEWGPAQADMQREHTYSSASLAFR